MFCIFATADSGIFKNQFSVPGSPFSDVQLSQTCQEFFEMFVSWDSLIGN